MTRSSASSSSGSNGPASLPEELIFDSKLTTYANLNELNRMGIEFITLRRRSQKLLDEVARTPASAWRRIELESVSRTYRTPRILDRRIRLKDYDGPLRQLTITDLGHEEPTLLLTNQLDRAAAQAHRPLRPADADREQHRGRHRFLPHGRPLLGGGDEGQLRPATDPDGQQPLPTAWPAASATATRSAKSRHLFRDFIDASAGDRNRRTRRSRCRFQKRAHNPLLIAAECDKMDIAVPWLSGKRLRLIFG